MRQQKNAVIKVCLLVAVAGCQRSTTPDLASDAREMTVVISPPAGAILQCNAIQLTATARDASGASITVDSAKWSSSDTSVATVSTSGVVRALQPSSGVTVRTVAYHHAIQGSAQVVYGVFTQEGSCLPR